MKRAIGFTYHNVSKKHLQRYINESAFRHNVKVEERFNTVISKLINIHLDYDTLIGRVA